MTLKPLRRREEEVAEGEETAEADAETVAGDAEAAADTAEAGRGRRYTPPLPAPYPKQTMQQP